jgi:ribose 5-phosphate isomerase B
MLYLASDHRGFIRKNQLKQWLKENKISYKDLGVYDTQKADYPDIALSLGQKVRESELNRGIAFCGSGAGVCVAANKIKGIRCGLGFNHTQVKSFVEDDHINILAIAADYTSKFKTFQLAKSFLGAEYSDEERFIRRLKKVEKIEQTQTS